nr:hypothetical protein BaRGS_004019 [Batillaria attramentaria]
MALPYTSVGVRGEQVLVKRSLFRNKLYPAGLAVYATPDNLAMFAEEKKAKGLKEDEKSLGVFAEMVNGVKSATVKGCIILRHNDPAKDEFVPLPKLWQPC